MMATAARLRIHFIGFGVSAGCCNTTSRLPLGMYLCRHPCTIVWLARMCGKVGVLVPTVYMLCIACMLKEPNRSTACIPVFPKQAHC
jgi:hypothetical protein